MSLFSPVCHCWIFNVSGNLFAVDFLMGRPLKSRGSQKTCLDIKGTLFEDKSLFLLILRIKKGNPGLT